MKQTLDNGSTFGVQRTKLNENFTELYTAMRPYKVYSALVSYNGSFSVIVLENTLGGSAPTYDVPFASNINITSASNSFVSSKTFILLGNANNEFIISSDLGNTPVLIGLQFKKHDGTSSSTPYFDNLPIEIRVYN